MCRGAQLYFLSWMSAEGLRHIASSNNDGGGNDTILTGRLHVAQRWCPLASPTFFVNTNNEVEASQGGHGGLLTPPGDVPRWHRSLSFALQFHALIHILYTACNLFADMPV